MKEVVEALEKLAEAASAHLREASDTKYGAVARSARELKQLAREREYEDVLDADLPPGQYADISTLDENDVLLVDTDNIPVRELVDGARNPNSKSEYVDLLIAFKQLHKVTDGFPIKNRRGIAKVMKSEEEVIDEVIDLFRDRIPSQLLPVLEEALVLREMDRVKGLSQDEVRDLRYEIGNQYSEKGNDPQEAQHLVSLCSMGYLDDGDVFDQMYDSLVVEGDKTQEEYRDIFKRYVNKNPFAVFVRPQDKSVEDIVEEATDKSSQILRWPGSPEFVEICGKGSARDLVSDVYEELEGVFDGEIEKYRNDDLEQYILTLYPEVPIE